MRTALPSQLIANGTSIIDLPGKYSRATVELPKYALKFAESHDRDAWNWATNEAMNNGKPLVDWQGQPMFAELAVASIFRSAGWQAYWSECYGGLVFLDRMPNLPRGSRTAKLKQFGVTIDPGKASLIESIRRKCTVPNYSCLDLIAWTPDRTVLVELKHIGRGKAANRGRKARDKLTDAQLRFVDAALESNLLVADDILIVEWQFSTH